MILSYLQVAGAGAYFAATAAILFGRWRAPGLSHPWFVIGLFLAFGYERASPEYANFSDPAIFIFAVLIGVQIVRASGGEHRGLWRALTFIPLLVVLLIASSARFPEVDAGVMHATESALLAAPIPIVLGYIFFGWMARGSRDRSLAGFCSRRPYSRSGSTGTMRGRR